MRQDSRLPRVLHALLHLEQMQRPATSEELAQMLGTNSAVVRRTMGGLREAGFVISAKGHGGGWTLAKPLKEISLLALYEALGSPALFAIGPDQGEVHCLLARAANEATNDALAAARATFMQRLGAVSVGEIVEGWDPGPGPHPLPG